MTDERLAQLLDGAEGAVRCYEDNAEPMLELARALRDQRLLNRGVVKILRGYAETATVPEAQEAFAYSADLIERATA
jgi:hypothetical protein